MAAKKKCPFGLKRGEVIPGSKPTNHRNFCAEGGCLMAVSPKKRNHRLLVCSDCRRNPKVQERRRYQDAQRGTRSGRTLSARQSYKMVV